MKDQKNDYMFKIQLLFLSFFGTGYSPKAPGTVGSLATIPLFYYLSYLGLSIYEVLAFTLIIFFCAVYFADKAQKKLKSYDPGWIVIDEVIGMLITWCFAGLSTNLSSIVLVFICFRLFDIIKIFPASWFDKKLKNGFATIFDDVISAVYAGFAYLLITKSLLFFK